MTEEPDNPDVLAEEVRSLLSGLGLESRALEPLPGESERADRDLALILVSPQDAPAGRPSWARRAGRPLLLLATAAVLAIGLVIVRPFAGSDPVMATTPAILQITDGGGTVLEQATEPASDELRRLAGLARRAPAPSDGPVQLIVRSSWLLSTDEGAARGRSVLVPVHSEQYFQPDGTVRTIERRSQPLDSSGQLTDEIGSWSDARALSDQTFAGPVNGPDYPSTLSTDPVELAEQLVPDPAECEVLTHCLVAAANSLHYNYVIEPRLSSGLLEMLAQRPDIRFAGSTSDRLDRPAEAFVAPGADASRRIIVLIDPETGELLGSEEVLVEDSAALGLDAPAVIEFTALEESRRIAESDVPDASLTTRY